MARFFVPGLPDSGRVELRGAAVRHLRSVLRLRRGDRVELFDGAGRSVAAEIRTVGPVAAELEIVGELRMETEPRLSLTLAVALSKGSKLDWVVEKATELGVTRIVPFTSERTVPVPGDASRRSERWRRIAAAAAAQSGRRFVPEVREPLGLAEVFASARHHDDAILFWEAAATSGAAAPTVRKTVLAVTGPEGGFSAAEAAAAATAGLRLESLGPRILRAETAAIVAVTLCQLRWGDLGAGQ